MTAMDGLDAPHGPHAPAAPDALRQLVREVLRDVLPAALGRQPNPVNVTSTGSEPVERHIHGVAGGAQRALGGAQRAGETLRGVRLTSDDELHAFVQEVLRLARDPQRRQDMLTGRLRFTLAPSAHGGQARASGAVSSNGSDPPMIPKDLRRITPQSLRDHEGPGTGTSRGGTSVVRRVEKGAVTERAVIAAAKAGARLVLGPRAMLTPLARDKARALGVPVEKER